MDTGSSVVDGGVRATLTGTVMYVQRIALPPSSVVRVRLEDVSRADAPSETLAEQTIPTEGRQVPIPFALEYDPSQIESERRYVVRAEIRDGEGALRWTTDTAFPVLTQGAPSEGIEVRVVPVASSAESHVEASALVGPTWRLLEIGMPDGGAETPEAAETNTITFAPDGRISGQADCNRFFGSYTVEGESGLSFSRIGSTLAACPPPSSADAYLRTLNAVESFVQTGNRLRLKTADGHALTFAREDDGAERMIPQETGRTFAFDCEDAEGGSFSFTMKTGPGEAALWLPERFGERYLVLGQVRAASGVRYEGDGVVLWTKGDEALLEVDGERFEGCTLDSQRSVWEHARRSGVDFRAIGQEPGWHLEIRDGDRITFVYDYGQQEAVAPAPAPTRTGNRTVYRAETQAHDLTVTITDEPCTDAMSGEAFEASVTVELDGETFRGCGRLLR